MAVKRVCMLKRCVCVCHSHEVMSTVLTVVLIYLELCCYFSLSAVVLYSLLQWIWSSFPLSFSCLFKLTDIYALPVDITWQYHITGSVLSVVGPSQVLCRRSDGLELTTGQSPWPGAQQRPFQTTVEDELILALPPSTHSAVEMLHDSALYKFMIDKTDAVLFFC